MRLYLTLDPMGDPNAYTYFLYRENIETGERQYASPLTTNAGSVLRDEATDVVGLPADMAGPIPPGLVTLEQSTVWLGNAPPPGLWHWVGEIRSADTTQLVKRVYAKFVVTRNPVVVFGADGTDTELSRDTTWNNDTVYRILHQVFVNAGATLTIEPGTVIVASGQNAVLVVERGGKIMAEGTARGADRNDLRPADRPALLRLLGRPDRLGPR